MPALEFAIKVLVVVLSALSSIFVVALIFAPAFRESGVSTSIGVVLGALGTPLAAIATGAYFTRGMRESAEKSSEGEGGNNNR